MTGNVVYRKICNNNDNPTKMTAVWNEFLAAVAQLAHQ